MTRLHVALAGPAALLGGLMTSAVLVAGNAEIGQLQASGDRRFPVVAQSESPFRVIGGIDVPDPAPPRESVPSPSAAAAPAANPPAPAEPIDDLLAPPPLPEDVPAPGYLRNSGHRAADQAPEPARGLLHPLVDTVLDTTRQVTDTLGVTDEGRQVGETVSPPLQETWRDARERSTETWQGVRQAR